MKILTSGSLNDAGYKCIGVSNYRVGFAFGDWRSIESYAPLEAIDFHAGRHMFCGQEIQLRVSRSNGIIHIWFPNGSLITLFVINEGSRGRRFNEIYVDSAISPDLIKEVLSPMEIQYGGNTWAPVTWAGVTGGTLWVADSISTLTATVDDNTAQTWVEYLDSLPTTSAITSISYQRDVVDSFVTSPKPPAPEPEYTISKEKLDKFLRDE